MARVPITGSHKRDISIQYDRNWLVLPLGKVIIKVVGSDFTCGKCINALLIATRVAKRKNVDIEHIDAFSKEGQKFRVLVVPSIYINDRLVSAGDVLSEGELERLVDETLLGNPIGGKRE